MKPSNVPQDQPHCFEDDYIKLQTIGQGSYGDVFKAQPKNGKGQIKAVKRIILDPLAEDYSQVQKLKLLKNDHIIQYYGYIVQNQWLYIIMKCCKGNLKHQIKEQKKFDGKQVVNLLMQITSAMLLLVQKNIMHLDLKPENILYEDEDYYKICDFGCSQLYQSLSRISNMNISPKKSSFPVYFDQPIFGTPQYIAPQVQLNHNVIPRSSCDVWSMGIILYQIIYHKHPFKLNNQIKIETKDFQDFKQGRYKIDFPQKSQKYPIDLIKLMLIPDQFQRISWSKIKKYLIQHYGKQQAQFINLEEAAQNQVNLSVIFANVIFTIDNNLTEQLDQFRQNNLKDLREIKNILIKLGYGLIVKFFRLFGYKIKYKLSATTRASIQFMFENIKQQFNQLHSKQNYDDNQLIKKLQGELCLKLQKLNTQITNPIKQKWQSVKKIACFAEQAIKIKTFFCAGHLFKQTCKIYGIQPQD